MHSPLLLVGETAVADVVACVGESAVAIGGCDGLAMCSVDIASAGGTLVWRICVWPVMSTG
jgi:hypothetical protein